MSLGRDDATGKYKQLSRTYRGDAAGADDALAALVAARSQEPARRTTNGHSEPAIGHADSNGDQRPAEGLVGLRQLIAALPLEAGELVVGWSADRAETGVAVPDAEYDNGDAEVYRLVQLHRLRRLSTTGGSGRSAPRTVWVRREVVEEAQPALGHDCAIHVWTV